MKSSSVKKLTLNKTVIRSLTPDETEHIAGGMEYGKDPTPTGGMACLTINISLAICGPIGDTITRTNTGGTGDAGCTTGGGETSACGG
ncbi:class I lanthipeptide [Undibacterium sp. TJN19]|uniref:class I lanthipeptide n=1 Tax=Undibacterium sp. TJN19 TaxID=3413055 RepID=UPI003BF1ABFA